MPSVKHDKVNRLVIAAAGSGKTSFLVSEAIDNPEGRVLITTFTQANEAEIRSKILERCKCIPAHITVQTWFSFLLRHGARPFQGCVFDGIIRGLVLVNGQSAVKYYMKGKGWPVLFKEETEFEQHYFTKDFQIYSDKLAKFVFRCNEKSEGRVVQRLEKLYSHIFIDEVQDLAGYDFELVRLLLKSSCTVQLVGDPRQVTYSTHWEHRNKQYLNGKVKEFIKEKCSDLDCLIEERFLSETHRNNDSICTFANRLYPDFEPCKPSKAAMERADPANHTGIFLVDPLDVDKYLETFGPMQLRWSRSVKVNEKRPVMNYGDSKGRTFDRVLIYPTGWVKQFLATASLKQADSATTIAKLYVAVTRAKHSVAFVCGDAQAIGMEGVERFAFD